MVSGRMSVNLIYQQEKLFYHCKNKKQTNKNSLRVFSREQSLHFMTMLAVPRLPLMGIVSWQSRKINFRDRHKLITVQSTHIQSYIHHL